MKNTIQLHVVLDIFSAWNFTSALTALLCVIMLDVVKLDTTVGQFFSCVNTTLKWSVLVCLEFIISENLECCAIGHFNSCLLSKISYTHYDVELQSVSIHFHTLGNPQANG